MNFALVLAGGTSSRLGADIPKQYIEVCGKPVFGYCLDIFQKSTVIDKIFITAAQTWHDTILKYCREYNIDKFSGFALPGDNRQLSVLNGLEEIKKDANDDDAVIIHDAARPCIDEKLTDKCFEALKGYDGVMPALPMKDTVYLSNDGKSIGKLLEREKIYAGQAPLFFWFGKYYEANIRLLPDEILKINGSAEPAVMNDMKIRMIDGDENNFKITTKKDLLRFCELCGEKR